MVSPLSYLALRAWYSSALGLPLEKKARKSVSRLKRERETREVRLTMITRAMTIRAWSETKPAILFNEYSFPGLQDQEVIYYIISKEGAADKGHTVDGGPPRYHASSRYGTASSS